jgi:type I restriction-modification system DNA methylase subunit
MIDGAATVNTSHFLQQAYIDLDLRNGDLIEVKDTDSLDEREFIDKAQWLNLCRYINRNNSFKAESIFFVENNPVIVFVNSTETDESRLHEIYNKIWCMANPRLLFISTQGELNVYDLADKPVRKSEELNPLETVKKAADIASILKKFRRESVESGEVFGDERFGKIDSRADKALIDDIKTLRKELFKEGLDGDKLKYAHALIGRSIFIRYLEDRGILTKDYFFRVAGEKPEWQKLLEGQPSKPDLYPEMSDLQYLKVLSDKGFTYCLYEKLADDFNGDMFPTDQNEKMAVQEKHLILLQRFLKGDVGGQESLFFWAYKFDIIPIELISNIYEALYHYEDLNIAPRKKKGSHGTHYTPASLVEFVLKKVLTVDKLKTNPRVIDPACGSGIFLVEAFRRIVRFRLHGIDDKTLSFSSLEEILKNQIAGIELNPEAVRIAAFSLYLAFLHYQEPPDILRQIEKGNKLPHLVYTDGKKKGKKYFDILIHANAFTVEEAIPDEKVRKKFTSGCADIVVGNPPWGKVSEENKEGNIALQWCESRGKVTSNREISQTFMWRAVDLLKDGCTAALLVSSGVILQSSDKSNRFKQNLLLEVRIQEVVNFVHVRQLFFSGAISPFISIVFNKETPPPDTYISYWTARKTKVIENTKAVVLDKTDFKFFKHTHTVNNDIWKIYFLGNHRDYSLISGLRLFPKLKSFEVKNLVRRQGFKESKKGRKDAGWLKKYRELPCEALENKYGPLDIGSKLRPVPHAVREKGTPEIYEGMRILIRGGPAQKGYREKGQIIARLEKETFAFRHSVNCIKLAGNNEEDYKVLLGILWSSLLRYYFFMTSSKWPIWHYQIYLEEILNIPVVFPEDKQLKDRLVNVVDKLRNYKPKALDGEKKLKQLERELDEAIFELYMLSDAECDLVRDRCKYDIDSFYNPVVMPIEYGKRTSGTFQSLPADRDKQIGLEAYLYVFLKSWNPEVEEGKELNWQTIRHPAVPMIAVILALQDMEEKKQNVPPGELPEWLNVLSELDKETQIPYSTKIYIEGMVRVVTKNQIIIIKRDEERLWTRSAAYEDVEATLLQAMKKERQVNT